MPVTPAFGRQKDENQDWPTSNPVSILKKSKYKPAKYRRFPVEVSHSFTPVILPVERLRQEEFHELNYILSFKKTSKKKLIIVFGVIYLTAIFTKPYSPWKQWE